MPNTERLLDQHLALIHASAIADEVVQARGYRSVTTKAELKRLGFQDYQCRVPALLVPIRNVCGELATYQIRPDDPRIKDGKALKYETPGGSGLVLDVPPTARPWLGDPNRPLFITEGSRKADAGVSEGLCCVALLGVWGFRGTNDLGGKVALPDWEVVALNGRAVYIVFDSDVMLKLGVHQALARLKLFLESRKASVRIIYLPPTKDGGKQGLDDFLAVDHTVDELLGLASSELRAPPPGEGGAASIPYRATPQGLEWLKPVEGGSIPVPLTNFTAGIVSDVSEDDGVEKRRHFEVEAALNGRTTRFSIPAPQFASMGWPTEHLGAGAIVFPGFGTRDHARCAVQMLSGIVLARSVFAHTGWRQLGAGWGYLHGGGAIGAAGSMEGVEVRLPDALARFVLPSPPEGEQLVEAIRASFGVLRLGPGRITIPVLAGTYRAVVAPADFALHAAGPTGAFKTELAALAQQHSGAGMDARHLPGSWSSTGNSLEGLAFTAKDALLVVDDFAPTGSPADVQRYHREADRLLRAQGNNAGRLRMRADATLRAAKPPRGLILSSGEDVPHGQSVRARVFILEVSPDDIDKNVLTACQKDAQAGLYAQALSGFIRWLAQHYDEVRKAMPGRVAELRQAAMREGQHRRTPEIVAHLAYGFDLLLAFAQDAGALTAGEREELWKEGWKALGEAAGRQAQHQAAAEPARRFLELLRAAIASGKAHVAGPNGGAPENPVAWGWRKTGEDWKASGDLVGWLNGQDLYLEPEAAFASVQKLGKDGGEGLSVASKTLHKRLHERGFLASIETKRGTLPVRRQLAGARRSVLHLHASSLIFSETAQPDHTAGIVSQPQPEQADAGAVGEADSPFPGPEPAPGNYPQPIDAQGKALGKEDAGHIGQVPKRALATAQTGDVGFPPKGDTVCAAFPEEPEKFYSREELTKGVAAYLNGLGGAPADNRKFAETQVAALFGEGERRRKAAQRFLEGYGVTFRLVASGGRRAARD